MLRFTPQLALAVTVLVACVGSEVRNRGSRIVVGDSAGVTIIDNGSLHRLGSADSLVLGLEIGVVEGGAEYQFFQVIDAKRLGDGAVAVTNGGTRELRIYESDGRHRATAGGAGQGPSEFRYPSGLVILPGDTIQVQDFLDRAYFTSDGVFLRRETGDRQALSELVEAAGGFSEGGGWLADGSYFAPVYAREQSPPRPGPLFRPSITFVRITPDFSALDTLGRYGGILQQYVDVGDQLGRSAFVPPFSANTVWALGSADGTIVVGDNATSQVERFHPDGTHSIIRWIDEAIPITDREVEAWKDRQRTAGWAQDRLPQLERAWAAMDIPDTKPHYGGVAVGSDGTLWVASDDPGEEATMLVFGPDGQFEGTMQLPLRFSVYDSGPGWVLGVRRDENDVEYVQLYER